MKTFDAQSSIIVADDTVLSALNKININSGGISAILFVIDSAERVVGSVSDGDVRRYLVGGGSLQDQIQNAMKKDFIFINDLTDYKQIKKVKRTNSTLVPVLSKDGKLEDVINFKEKRSILPVDAVIMSGGQGVRLKPYTDNVPKPMLELEGKPIIGHNIDRLILYGIKNFYISVNHLKEQIIKYVSENYVNINLEFIEEKNALGTIGALSLVEKYKSDDILVVNADILTNLDFVDMYESHKNKNSSMTVATFNVKVDIPYAVLNTVGSRITSFSEKPTYVYYSNAGIYMLNKETLKSVPYNQKYDATDLMEKLIQDNDNVMHFPIRGYWLDIGTIQNYSKAQEDIKFIKF